MTKEHIIGKTVKLIGCSSLNYKILQNLIKITFNFFFLRPEIIIEARYCVIRKKNSYKNTKKKI